MIAVDTSLVVAGFASWHESHATALRALAEGPCLLAHVALESYSVLTRLPPPHRSEPSIVIAFLGRRFPGAPLALPGNEQVELVDRAARLGVSGGAIYDALVGVTAATAGARLLTRDRRAIRTYELFDVPYEFLS